MIRFLCGQCGRKLTVADAHAGRRGKCPHCGHAVHIPQPGEAQPVKPPCPEDLELAPAPSQRDHAFLDLPREALQGTSEDGSGLSAAEAAADAEGAGNASAETPAGPADVLLYPTNADGLVHMVVLALALWGAELFAVLIAPFLGFYSAIFVVILKVLIVGYIIFYLGYSVYDSSRGGRRAPSIALAPPLDRGELFSQILLLLASIAICFWPAAVYYGLARRVDVWTVLLAAACGFFWPMALLTAVLFDGIDALNPLLIVRSIVVTLPAYVVLTLELGVLAVLAGVVHIVSAQVPVPRVFCSLAYLYLLLSGTHLLGRHYWRHRDRLDWGL